jgi:hypothetical protein
MSGRHRARASKSNVVIGSIAASVGVSSVLAAAIVELVAPEPSTAATQSAPQTAEQPLTQQGKLIAVTADSLTAQSPNGLTQTYRITPSTTAITDSGSQTPTAAAAFTVNDEVTIVGTRRGDAVVATAVAEQSAMGPAGRPMEYGI